VPGEEAHMIGADYPFADLMWSMLIFFLWIMWLWMLFAVFADVFRRRDISGWAKTGWLIFVIVLPFLGVFVYLISQHDGIAERSYGRASAQQARLDAEIREATGGGGAAAEIEKGKALLDSGAITAAEFDAIKQKALA
jgi:hypothetical protein